MTPLRRDLVLSALSSPGQFADIEAAHLAELARMQSSDCLSHSPTNEPGSMAQAGKAVFDRAAATLALIALFPLMLVIGMMIRLESPGPALFTQERVGFRRQIFKCYKFRSMYHHMQDARGTQQATRDDVRVTKFGRFLRRSSLDELPQLLNVVKGEMALVGPRPHAPDTKAAGRNFADIVPNYDARHCVRPGITGWAQVNGWRGETRCAEDIQMRVRYDMDYIRNWSIGFDCKIILLTLVRMFNDDTAV
jgi:exopolysaccharide biosynthesis polyprenyl glycosylphosphotransferase